MYESPLPLTIDTPTHHPNTHHKTTTKYTTAMRTTRKRNQGDDDERHGGVDVGPPGNVSPQDGNFGGKVDDVATPYKKKQKGPTDETGTGRKLNDDSIVGATNKGGPTKENATNNNDNDSVSKPVFFYLE